jgi:uncharacterized protein (UPF0248 family)
MNAADVKRLLEKERLEKNALNRIRWDKTLAPNDFSIRYLDRVRNTLVEAPYTNINLDGDFFHHQENLIPMHRIREIIWKGEVVWAKRKNRT